MKATYTKLKDGSWGIRVTDGTPSEGSKIEVKKKSGETKVETVSKVLWSGDGIVLCSIVNLGRSGKSRGGSLCAECGRPGELHYDLEDGLMKHYGCCDIPE